jgi:hypothetical protein
MVRHQLSFNENRDRMDFLVALLSYHSYSLIDRRAGALVNGMAGWLTALVPPHLFRLFRDHKSFTLRLAKAINAIVNLHAYSRRRPCVRLSP